MCTYNTRGVKTTYEACTRSRKFREIYTFRVTIISFNKSLVIELAIEAHTHARTRARIHKAQSVGTKAQI